MSLLYDFRSSCKTGSDFDLRFLLFVMTLIIFSFTRFILQRHVIVFSVYVCFLRNFLFTVKITLFFHLVYVTKACDRPRYCYVKKKKC